MGEAARRGTREERVALALAGDNRVLAMNCRALDQVNEGGDQVNSDPGRPVISHRSGGGLGGRRLTTLLALAGAISICTHEELARRRGKF